MLVGLHLVPPTKKPVGLDVSEPFAGYSYNVGLYPLPGEALPKARQWCRALQRQIRDTWWSAVETDTHVAPGGAVHHETEAVMVEAALSVASIQVLYELFLGAYPRQVPNDMTSSDFERHCHADAEGQVVSGLKLIRNGEMHADSIVIPDVKRVVGVMFDDGTQGYRIFPHWATYHNLPSEVREARYRPPKNAPPGTLGALKTNQVHHDHYDRFIGGQPVVDTLLDTLSFFSRCDPRIVRMNSDGDPSYFPLDPISERDYERRHPEWKPRRQVEKELRELCESNPPSGVRRTCVAHLQGSNGEVVAHCGFTTLSSGSLSMFTETSEQIAPRRRRVRLLVLDGDRRYCMAPYPRPVRGSCPR